MALYGVGRRFGGGEIKRRESEKGVKRFHE